MELYNKAISHVAFLVQHLAPAKKKALKFSKMRMLFHDYTLPGTDRHAPEYLISLEGKQKNIGFDCHMVRQADMDDPKRIVKFFWDCIQGTMPSFSWYYLRSFPELVRVEKGISAPPKPEQNIEFEHQKRKDANDHMREAYDKGLAYAEDITAVSKRHDELFRAKIEGERETLEILGPDGKSLDVAKSLSQKLEE